MNKIKDIWGKVVNSFRKQPPPQAPVVEQPQPIKLDLSTYIYLNKGLNRHERRRLGALYRKNQLSKMTRAFAKMSPTNIPATQGMLNENSLRRKNGEPILVLSGR